MACRISELVLGGPQPTLFLNRRAEPEGNEFCLLEPRLEPLPT
ncbi:hypothetical protein [Actinosynnema sp. NPDC020468]